MMYYENLDGVSFKIHQALNMSDLLCVWAGADCSKFLGFLIVSNFRTSNNHCVYPYR